MAELNIILPPGDAPVLSDNALTVLQSRYLMKDYQDKCIETPAQLLSRVASPIANAEAKYGANSIAIKEWHRKYYELMASLKFLPNSPAFMNTKQSKGILSACFVLPIEDSIEAIFETIKQTAVIQKADGGTGFSFDKLRPTGDRVGSCGWKTSGPISFLRVFSETTNAIQQGTLHRSANIGTMSVEHPDILKFIYAKQSLKAFTNFNISVKVTDDWMKTLTASGSSLHVVKNPRTQQQYLLPRRIDIANYSINNLYELTGKPPQESNQPGKFYTVSDIWKMIVECAHKTGEPGLTFIDRINRDNPTSSLGHIEAISPCSEQPLLPYESCILSSINLVKFVTSTDGKTDMDWPALAETVKLAVRFLDNTIDVCGFPVREVASLTQANRKIGLGVMGFADCLFFLGIPYDSRKGIEFGETLMKFINKNAQDTSSELANSRGPFPNWNNSTWRTEKKRKVRNASITCIASTGIINSIAVCSCGIEPASSLVFARKTLGGSKVLQMNPIFKQIAEKNNFYSEELVKQIAEVGRIDKISQIPSEVCRIFKCAYDIKPEWHIQMQAAFQQHCDGGVSKTINFSEKATVVPIDKAYRLAHQLGCKGIRIYRKSRRECEPMNLY